MQDNIATAKRLLGLVGRGLLGLYFILPGISKVASFEQTGEAMAAKGVPLVPVLLVLTIIIQIGGGAALLLGFRAQIIAFVLAGLTLVISLFMHDFWAIEEAVQRGHEMQNFIKNMAIMAGLMFVAAASIDRVEQSAAST